MEHGDVVPVKDDELYPTIGVLNSGRGTFKRADLPGSATTYKQLFRVTEGDVIFSKLKAFEGAIAIVPSEHDRHFVSSEFPTFTIAESVSKEYISHALRSEFFESQLRKASRGLGARRERVHPRDFLQLGIPLPDITVQQAIAARLDAIVECSNRIPSSGSDIETLLDAEEATIIAKAMTSGVAPLSSVAEINPPPARIRGDELVHFVPMADVDHVTGAVAGQQLIVRSELGAGYKQFRAGDIIFARITPSMQNGKSAVFFGALAPVGYGSTEFHVLRPNEARFAEPLHTILRTKWFRDRAMKSFTGTAGQQRVPVNHLMTSVIPDLSQSSAAALIQELRDIDSTRREAKRLFDLRSALAMALPQAARNAEFARLMS